MKEAHDHHRVSPEGKRCGEQMARLAEKAVTALAAAGEPDERCKTCAFREGTVPNGCIQTQADALKAVMEGVPFTCHVKKGWPCHGWFALRVAAKGRTFSAPWAFSPPESQSSGDSHER